MSATLVIVYNADDGMVAAVADAIHKVVSPATYPCALCAITHGAVRMRPAWRAYLRSLPYPTRFLHRQGFARAYPGVAVALPAILLDRDGEVRVLVDAAAMKQIGRVDELIDRLSRALAARMPPPGTGPSRE